MFVILSKTRTLTTIVFLLLDRCVSRGCFLLARSPSSFPSSSLRSYATTTTGTLSWWGWGECTCSFAGDIAFRGTQCLILQILQVKAQKLTKQLIAITMLHILYRIHLVWFIFSWISSHLFQYMKNRLQRLNTCVREHWNTFILLGKVTKAGTVLKTLSFGRLKDTGFKILS